jgi:putative ABC transport system ATP-binding protein
MPFAASEGESYVRPSVALPSDNVPSGTPPERAQEVLVARALTKIYQMGEVEVQALRGVDFALRRGELLVLLGASGSGKSTLLNIVGGLDVPTSGRVFYENQELTEASDNELTLYRRRHVGFVFQFYNLIPSLTAEENVALVTDISADSLDPRDALQLVGLADRAHHFPAQLSGGEQQRVAIARAVAKQPDILLCDEPTGALDYRTGVAVLEVIDNINRQLGTSTAVITHNAPVAKMADRVVWLADGRITSDVVNTERVSPRDLTW